MEEGGRRDMTYKFPNHFLPNIKIVSCKYITLSFFLCLYMSGSNKSALFHISSHHFFSHICSGLSCKFKYLLSLILHTLLVASEMIQFFRRLMKILSIFFPFLIRNISIMKPYSLWVSLKLLGMGFYFQLYQINMPFWNKTLLSIGPQAISLPPFSIAFEVQHTSLTKRRS